MGSEVPSGGGPTEFGQTSQLPPSVADWSALQTLYSMSHLSGEVGRRETPYCAIDHVPFRLVSGISTDGTEQAQSAFVSALPRGLTTTYTGRPRTTLRVGCSSAK